jgi:hypothetical protein
MQKVTVSKGISGVIATISPNFYVISNNYRWILGQQGNIPTLLGAGIHGSGKC